jgi:hypothetical protein
MGRSRCKLASARSKPAAGKARQSRGRRLLRAFRASSWLKVTLVAFVLTLMLPPEIAVALVRLVQTYPSRFLAFYEPKVAAVGSFARRAMARLEMSNEMSDACDFSVALVTVACVHQTIEAIRATFASKLQPTNAQ